MATTVAVPAAAVLPAPGSAEYGAIVEAPSESAALAAAKASGQRVEVASARTELSQVFAEPSGRLTYEAGVVPQRTKRADGSWAAIDLNLRRGEDGLWRPGASVADVRFSNGGNGPAVTLVREGKTFTMSWPASLPAPVVAADSATYPEVLSGVDLVLRATRAGFTHVLVVKNRAAALNPALRQIRFTLGGDAKVEQLPNGSLRASVGRKVLATSRAGAQMWSSGTAAGPGESGRTAKIGVKAEARTLLLTPDVAMLTAPQAQFPMYIDPDWSADDLRWAYSNDEDDNNVADVARVGYSPGESMAYRSFFDFPTTDMSGKHIRSAYVHMRLDHSSACVDTATYLYASWSGIKSTPRTDWATTTANSLLSWANSHANEAGGCGVLQPDMDVNFFDPTSEDKRITNLVQDVADYGGPQITMAFVAPDESTTDGWKKFFLDQARLIVDYSTPPGQPNGLKVAGVDCPSSGRLQIGTLSPVFSAVYPDADSSQTLTGKYEWLEIPTSGTYNDSTPRKTPPQDVAAAAGGRATTAAVSGVTANKAYAFRVQTTDPPPYDNLRSAWSPWCEFTPNTTPALMPTVASTGTIGGPGSKLTVTISSSESDITKFRYGWSLPPTLEIVAPASGAKTVTVNVTIPKYGTNVLYAYAINAVGNRGPDGSVEIKATRPAPPVAQWGLESYPGQSVAQALEDKQPGLPGNTPLTSTGLTWTPDARMIGGQTAAVGGTTRATTAGAVVDTTKSFSVAGWYRQTDSTNGHHVIVSQEGGAGDGFALAYYPPYATWGFNLSDQAGGNWVNKAPVAANKWIHVAGVFDAQAAEMRLYLDGVLAGTQAVTTTRRNATGKVHIGAAILPGGTWTGAGQVADVRVYDRVLVDDDFTGKLKSDPASGGFDEPGMLTVTELGNWNFDAATPCYDLTIEDTCEAPDSSPWNRMLKETVGVETVYGHRGSTALALDNTESAATPGPLLLTDQSFTVSAWVYLPSTVTASQTVLSQQTFKLSYSGTDNKWYFGTHSGPVFSSGTATKAAWVHLVGVFDAGNKKAHLYVDGQLQGTATTSDPTTLDVPFVVGSHIWQGIVHDYWQGSIDDVSVYRGAMTPAAVQILHEGQL